MLAVQALPTQTQSKPKSHFARNLALGVIVAVIITAILTSAILSDNAASSGNQNINPNNAPGMHTQGIISGSIALNPTGDYFTGFNVPENALNPVLQGNFTSIGNSTNNNVVVSVWSQKEFINYLNGDSSSPSYNKDLFPMVTGNINITLSRGNYFIVFGSASMEGKIVSVQIDLTYSIS
jgi:hypothetical protein